MAGSGMSCAFAKDFHGAQSRGRRDRKLMHDTITLQSRLEDLTEYVNEERAFQAKLLDVLHDAVIGLDPTFHVRSWNRSAERLYGFTAAEAIGRHIGEVTGTEYADGEAGRERFFQEVATAGRLRAELVQRHRDGTRIEIECEANVLRCPDGSVAGYFVANRDITERKRAEESLARSEARFRALIEKSTDIIAVLDAEARFQFWSPSATEALGWRPEDVLGRRPFEFIHPDDRARVVETLRAVLAADGATARASMRYRHRNGTWREIESCGRNLLLDPAVGGLVVNSRDVTEQRVLERQLQQSQKLESVGQLAGGVAHDFNNLLTVILSGAEALRCDLANGSPPDAEVVDEIRAAGERARDLTRQLLTFARRQAIAPVALDLNALVRTSERLLRRVLGEDVALVTSLQSGLWPIRCDPGQVEQVVLNLGVNARDAMPRGGALTIETSNQDVGAEQAALYPGIRPGAHVRLAIHDTGTGMAPEVKARLFEPFFTTKPLGKGTGLGLATVLGIVKQSGGFVRVESEPGYGSTFEVVFPRIAEPVRPQVVAAPIATVGGREAILLVEDDPHVRSVTARALGAAGYALLLASNGLEAIEILSRHPGRLDLLITDVVMPGVDGRQLAEAVRKEWPEVRVLFLSGHAQDVLGERGMLEEGVDLQTKPYTATSLLARVRGALGRG